MSLVRGELLRNPCAAFNETKTKQYSRNFEFLTISDSVSGDRDKMDANSLQSMSPSQKDELMRTVQAQVALANMQEILSVSEWPKEMAIG